MREVIKALAIVFTVALVVALLAVGALVCSGVANAETITEQAWQPYEDAASKAGAGQQVPVPDDVLTPHQSWCESIPGWCPTVETGVWAGINWCQATNPKAAPPQCWHSHRNRSYQIYLEWKDWLDRFAGGFPGLFVAGTIRTESEGVVDAQTPSKTLECGIASVDRSMAQTYDVNACDPEANLWVAGVARNRRLLNLRERWPQLARAPLEQQWKLAGAAGAIGTNRVNALIEASGALRLREDGTLFYARPHERVLKWLAWADRAGKIPFYSFVGSALLGFNPGRGAFRVARPEAQEAILGPLYASGVPWGEPVAVPRPEGLDPFPGYEKHCECWRWPELVEKRPVPHLADPALVPPWSS